MKKQKKKRIDSFCIYLRFDYWTIMEAQTGIFAKGNLPTINN